MEIRTVRAFVEVVRQGGFSAAAKTLFATQPTISKALKQLEDELGTPLLARPGRTNQLTQAGEIVLRRGTTILAERDALLNELEELRGLRRGVLRIGLPPLGSAILFAPLFADYRQRYPEIEIVLQEHGTYRLRQSLMAGEIDLAALLLPVDDDLYESQNLRDEPMVALLPPRHPLGGREIVRLTELADSPFILFESGYALNAVILDACQRRGFKPREAARSGQIDFIVALVAAGLGIAMLPRPVARQHNHPSIHKAMIEDSDLHWQLGMIWRRGTYLPPSARAWLDLVESRLAMVKSL